MARSFLTSINLNVNEVQNFVVGRLSTTSITNLTGGALVGGRLQFDSTANVLKVYDGSAWQTLATGGSTFYIGTQQVSIGNTSGSVTALPGVTSVNGTTIPSSATLLTTTSTSSALTSVGTLTGLTMGGNIAMGTNKITGLGTPTADTDAATKGYVDGVAAGLNAHPAVNYATTGALGTTDNLVGGTITTTYNNGTNNDGVGATLTIATSSNWTAVLIDGQPLTVGDRVLIKNQGGGASSLQNGIYTVTTVGAVGNTTAFVFTRATDSNSTPEVAAGDTTYVLAGTKNGGNGFVQTAVITTIGTTPIAWSQYSGSSTVLAGSGLVTNGTNPNQLDVNTGTGITVNGSDQVIIDTAWAGQTAITTLGTIGTGTWQGTAITGQYGGTGVNNSGKTITLGGNLTTSGAFATTLTVTNTTSVTLPTSGTLMDNKMTTIGDILYASATGTPATYTRLAGNTATQPSFLSSTGNGSANTTTAFTSSTGSGNVVLATSPTISSPTISTITAATSAPMTIKSADSSSFASATTSVTIKSGDQSNATSNGANSSGSITVDAGTAGAGGTAGTISIGTSNSPTINIGRSVSTTTVTGAVRLPTVGTSGFVKLGASGALSADTNTYLTSSTGVTTVNGSSGAITNVAKRASGSIALTANSQSANIAHSLGQSPVLIQVYDATTNGNLVDMDVLIVDTNNFKLTSTTSATYYWVAIG